MNRPVYQAWQVGGTLYEEGYTYNSEEDGSLNTHHTATGQTLTMQYDGLRRLSGITGGIYGKTYTYRDISNDRTTTQIASVVYDLPTDQTYGYTYDNMGNIATYTDANGTVTYTYDPQGQLLSATDGTTTYSYTYDTVGNILTANGHTYAYTNADWKDLLTAYDGEAITYDAIGNPLSYYNGTRWTFTWEDGRQLATATDGTTNVSYTYDSDGIRTSKTVNGVKHTYVYASGKLLRETYGSNTLDFFYSNSGQPYAIKYNGTVYYYITNLQGDVMSIVDGTGAVVVSYKYDPYGNILSTTGTLADTLGQINPLRYRGYVYDQEIGLYYLQSRYYNAKVGRFLNADAFTYTGQGILGNNMFAYCNNRPAISVDLDGYDAIILINKDSVTHIGIMVQDENGTWWHFYWGAGSNDSSSSGSAAAVFGDVAPRTWCDPYAGDLTVDAINSSGQYSDYEDMCYLSGDFSACIDKMKNAKGMYNLYTNNCSQVSLGILAEANTQYQSILESASDIWLPYVAFIKVKALAATMEGYNKMTDNVRKIVDSFSNFVTNGR